MFRSAEDKALTVACRIQNKILNRNLLTNLIDSSMQDWWAL